MLTGRSRSTTRWKGKNERRSWSGRKRRRQVWRRTGANGISTRTTQREPGDDDQRIAAQAQSRSTPDRRTGLRRGPKRRPATRMCHPITTIETSLTVVKNATSGRRLSAPMAAACRTRQQRRSGPAGHPARWPRSASAAPPRRWSEGASGPTRRSCSPRFRQPRSAQRSRPYRGIETSKRHRTRATHADDRRSHRRDHE